MLLPHKPLVDQAVQEEIFSQTAKLTPSDIKLESWNSQNYFDQFESWLLNSTSNNIVGLGGFRYRAYCAGVNDAIAGFVARHVKQRRLRFSRAEFVGAKINSNSMQANWCWLEDDVIRPNDAVILSWPFAGNGNQYPNQNSLIETCEQMQVPVMIDIAYFGISHGMTFDLQSPCITDVAVSLSKPFSVPLRLGMRFCRHYNDDNIQSLSDSKIYNRMAVKLGIELMKQFPHDWLVAKYLPIYLDVCKRLSLETTPTFTLALGNAQDHSEFFRNGYYRICVTDELLQNIH